MCKTTKKKTVNITKKKFKRTYYRKKYTMFMD